MFSALLTLAAACGGGGGGSSAGAGSDNSRRDADLVAQRHHRPAEVDVAADRRRLSRGTQERVVQGRSDPERGLHHQGPARAPVVQPARHLPAVGWLPTRQARSTRARSPTSPTTCRAGSANSASPRKGWQVNGRQYGVPYDLHTVGFWYRKDLFARAGITSAPSTMDQLNADISALRQHGIVPDRDRQQGPVAGRLLLGVLRVARMLDLRPATAGRRAQPHRSVLDQGGQRPARVPVKQPVPERVPRHPGPAGRRQLGRNGRQRQGRHGVAGRLGTHHHGLPHHRQQPRQRTRLVPVPDRGGRQGAAGRRARRR